MKANKLIVTFAISLNIVSCQNSDLSHRSQSDESPSKTEEDLSLGRVPLDVDQGIIFAAVPGPGDNAPCHVKGWNKAGKLRFNDFAFSQSYTGGCTLALGDINADGYPELVVAAANNSQSPRLKIYDGKTKSLIKAFDPTPGQNDFFKIKLADVQGIGKDDILVYQEDTSSGKVMLFDGRSFNKLTEFVPYAGLGTDIATGVFSKIKGKAAVATLPGIGGSRHLRMFEYSNGRFEERYSRIMQPVVGSSRCRALGPGICRRIDEKSELKSRFAFEWNGGSDKIKFLMDNLYGEFAIEKTGMDVLEPIGIPFFFMKHNPLLVHTSFLWNAQYTATNYYKTEPYAFAPLATISFDNGNSVNLIGTDILKGVVMSISSRFQLPLLESTQLVSSKTPGAANPDPCCEFLKQANRYSASGAVLTGDPQILFPKQTGNYGLANVEIAGYAPISTALNPAPNAPSSPATTPKPSATAAPTNTPSPTAPAQTATPKPLDPIEAGLFRVTETNNAGAGYISNSAGQFCIFDSWAKYVNAAGGEPRASNLWPNLRSVSTANLLSRGYVENSPCR